MARIALVFNLIRPEMLDGRPLDAIAELDSAETIRAVEEALRGGGHEVIRIEADAEAPGRLRACGADIVFNIAEGLRGESRESLIPAVCELLGLPYTGSGVLTTALCLHKARAKQVLAQQGVPTPPWQVLERPEAALDPRLRFPLIVKLLHEGSSMGLSPDSIVDDAAALRRRATILLETYGQPALVEEFIEGREFTVGVLGNDDLCVLPIVEITFAHPRGINFFQPDEPVLEIAVARRGAPPPLNPRLHRPVCPAEVDGKLVERIRDTARRAYRALDCRDWCRLEMRLGPDRRLYVLELNPIAGIDPTYLLPLAASRAGLSYGQLINRILDLALARTGRQRA